MNLIVKKTLTVRGGVMPPSSKSQMIRAMIMASLARGTSHLENILRASDVDDAKRVCSHLGVNISETNNSMMMESSGTPLHLLSDSLYSGHSGITTHFVMPILGLRHGAEQPILLDCSEQMRARPVHALIDALKKLGLRISGSSLPVRISGELIGGKTDVSGVSSQYLSALLMALPCASKDSEITVNNLEERPYVDMTLSCLKKHNIHVEHESQVGKDVYHVKGGQRYRPMHYTIPSDFSSASYLIAAAVLIPGEVIITNIDMNEPQGDKRLVSILQEMGADITISPNALHIRGGKKLKGMEIDANDVPDLLPTLAVIGTQASNKTRIYNVSLARIKETDRIRSMAEGLSRMGANIHEENDGLMIYESKLIGNTVRGHGDHRTVMALALAGMTAKNETVIDDAEAVQKTFPRFVPLMQSMGANMEVKHENTP